MEKKTLAELRTEAENQIIVWNTAMFENKFDIANKANTAIEDAEKDYLAQAQLAVFEALKETENPMLSAIVKFDFPVIRHVDKKDKESGITTRELIVKDRQIDIMRLDDYCKRFRSSIASDKDWHFMVQRFNQLMCLRSAKELKIDPKKICDSYFMAEKAKEIDMGKTPDSNTAILKALQACIDAILFVDDGNGKNLYKATSHDVAFLLMTYTRKGKTALSVATANHGTMRNLVACILNRIATDKSYTLEYKEAKEKVIVSDVKTTEAKVA